MTNTQYNGLLQNILNKLEEIKERYSDMIKSDEQESFLQAIDMLSLEIEGKKVREEIDSNFPQKYLESKGLA